MSGPVAGFLIAGGMLWFGGVLVVSMAGDIPINRQLGDMADGGAAVQSYWPCYLRGRVTSNHIPAQHQRRRRLLHDRRCPVGPGRMKPARQAAICSPAQS